MCVCLCRRFRLYLRTNDDLFTDDFRAVVVDEDGRERSCPVNRQNYFTGHVIGRGAGSNCGRVLVVLVHV